MPAPITVIIPTLNCAATLGPTLGSIFDGVNAGLIHEVIFADGGSTDGLDQIATQPGATLITTAKGRGTQMAAAAKQAKTDWLLFLHADTTLSPDWPEIVQSHLTTSQNAAYFHLRFNATGFAPRLTASWANLRARLFHLPYGDQGLLIPRTLYTEIDGYPEIPLMEDVAIARKLRHKLTMLPIIATTNADKYTQNGWLFQGASNLKTLILYLLGRSPKKLAKSYQKKT